MNALIDTCIITINMKLVLITYFKYTYLLQNICVCNRLVFFLSVFKSRALCPNYYQLPIITQYDGNEIKFWQLKNTSGVCINFRNRQNSE